MDSPQVCCKVITSTSDMQKIEWAHGKFQIEVGLTRTQYEYTVQSYKTFVMQNQNSEIFLQVNVSDDRRDSQAGPSNANEWTRMGNSFLRALRCWNSGRNSAPVGLYNYKLKAVKQDASLLQEEW